jgi:hypothetical protein
MYYCPFVTLDFDAAVIHDELVYRWSPPPSRSPGGEGSLTGMLMVVERVAAIMHG